MFLYMNNGSTARLEMTSSTHSILQVSALICSRIFVWPRVENGHFLYLSMNWLRHSVVHYGTYTWYTLKQHDTAHQLYVAYRPQTNKQLLVNCRFSSFARCSRLQAGLMYLLVAMSLISQFAWRALKPTVYTAYWAFLDDVIVLVNVLRICFRYQ
jgi:hypothetical protein